MKIVNLIAVLAFVGAMGNAFAEEKADCGKIKGQITVADPAPANVLQRAASDLPKSETERPKETAPAHKTE